jgi:hypothetical protein
MEEYIADERLRMRLFLILNSKEAGMKRPVLAADILRSWWLTKSLGF